MRKEDWNGIGTKHGFQGSIVAHIRKNSTGEVVCDQTYVYLNDDSEFENGNSFIWKDGNFACDCNRHLFFERLINPDGEDTDVPCGFTLYSVNLYNAKTNQCFYKEFEETPQINDKK